MKHRREKKEKKRRKGRVEAKDMTEWRKMEERKGEKKVREGEERMEE